MKSFSILDRHARYAVTAILLLFATIVQAFVPMIASAATVTDRSIELSSSSKGTLTSGQNVTYNVAFTTATAARAVAIQFCSDTPLIGEDCAAPAGMSLASANVPSINGGSNDSRPTVVASMGPVIVIGNDDWDTPDDVTFEITGITNPSSAGPLYARIITYAGADMATAIASATDDYDASDNDGIGGVGTVGANPAIVKDTGSVALSITDQIGVDAAVLETLTFCAASAAITANCANASSNLPNLTLGEGTPKALTSSQVSTGDIFTQLSTNAVGGAVVSIKSGNTNCSGLALNGGATCAIAAAGTTGTFTGGTAKLGLFVNPTTGSNTGTGTIELTSGDATVTGTGTAWVDTPTVKVGDTIWTNGGRAYTVLSITSNTALELTANASASESTAAYTYGFGTYRVFSGGGTYSNTDYRLDDTNVRSAYGDPLLDTNDGVVNGGNIKLTFGASISNTTPAGKYSNAYSLIATGKF